MMNGDTPRLGQNISHLLALLSALPNERPDTITHQEWNPYFPGNHDDRSLGEDSKSSDPVMLGSGFRARIIAAGEIRKTRRTTPGLTTTNRDTSGHQSTPEQSASHVDDFFHGP